MSDDHINLNFIGQEALYEVYTKCHKYDKTHTFDAMIELLDS